jgi:hypothetical protein
MAGTLTPYGAGQYLLSVHRPDLYVAPASLYFTVTRAVPISNAEGEDLDEPDASYGFARVAYPLIGTDTDGTDFWTPTETGGIFNGESRLMDALTTDAGLAQGYAVVDALDIGTGNVWAVGAIAEPFSMDVGVQPFFDVGDVMIELAG